jgi:hypothetical protein
LPFADELAAKFVRECRGFSDGLDRDSVRAVRRAFNIVFAVRGNRHGPDPFPNRALLRKVRGVEHGKIDGIIELPFLRLADQTRDGRQPLDGAFEFRRRRDVERHVVLIRGTLLRFAFFVEAFPAFEIDVHGAGDGVLQAGLFGFLRASDKECGSDNGGEGEELTWLHRDKDAEVGQLEARRQAES